MIQGMISSRRDAGRSVIFSEIADKIDKPIQMSSIERRIQDFFAKVSLDYQQLAVFLMSFVPHPQLTLSIDRTEWDFGKTQVNVLCVVVSIGKMAVPVYFEMLDNKSGNSNAQQRIALFKSLIRVVGKQRIQMLVMDTEFIGQNGLPGSKASVFLSVCGCLSTIPSCWPTGKGSGLKKFLPTMIQAPFNRM